MRNSDAGYVGRNAAYAFAEKVGRANVAIEERDDARFNHEPNETDLKTQELSSLQMMRKLY